MTKHPSRNAEESTGKSKNVALRRGRGEATELACSRLMRIIDTMSPHDRLPGLRTLQAQIGVSQGTLNAALDKLEQKRVLFRRERSGVFVAPHIRRRTICLICSLDFFLRSNGSPFWQFLVERAEAMASAHETRLSIAFAEAGQGGAGDTLPEYLRDEIRQNNFDGVIAVGLPAQAVTWIESKNVPVVSFAGSSRYTVMGSRSSLIEQGVAALGQSGCQSIALMLPAHDLTSASFPRWEQAFHECVKASGAKRGEIATMITQPIEENGRYRPPRIEHGWDWVYRVFGADADEGERPDGVIIGDDMIALGVLMAFDNLGIVLGRDVVVASYANAGSPVLLGWHKRVYRLEYDVSALVERLFATLTSLMDHGADALSGAFVPPFDYNTTEYPAVTPGERFQLVLPRLLPPETINL
ncbi:MAG: GntR family transcriptional regulator [Armatimonadetes bacterium]|nr:GntR family transcriptional regulator [Armatimonadota bacterium]